METQPPKTLLAIEIAFAAAEAQAIIPIEVPVGTTIAEAIQLSGILARFPEIRLNNSLAVGIFGLRRSLEWEVAEGDRVEIYRALAMDPKEQRRLRAKQNPIKRKR